MKIILLKDVAKIGKTGEIKEVANGFALNFLIPNDLAEPATEKNIQSVQKREKENQIAEEKSLALAQKTAEKLEGKEFVFQKETRKEKLFGAIKPKEIVEKILSETKVSLEEKNIQLEKSIKKTGEYPVKIKLDHQIETEIKIIIEAA